MAVRLPRIFRTTPFRLTLLFLALFASAAAAFLAYIYVATAGEATRRTDRRDPPRDALAVGCLRPGGDQCASTSR